MQSAEEFNPAKHIWHLKSKHGLNVHFRRHAPVKMGGTFLFFFIEPTKKKRNSLGLQVAKICQN